MIHLLQLGRLLTSIHGCDGKGLKCYRRYKWIAKTP